MLGTPEQTYIYWLDQLQMYDIRFAPNGIQRKPKPNAHHHTSTRPYLTFPDYSPDVIPDFDVSTELNLLASGTFHFLSSSKNKRIDIFFCTASDNRQIQLFSLHTGAEVSSPLSKYRYSYPITCVCFESSEGSHRQGPQTPSLLVCSNATVDQWIW